MSTTAASTEAKPRTLAPNEIPFTDGPLPFRNYTSDTGKILPRKWTHLPAKQQRAVTKTIKRGRNNLMAL